MQPWSYAQLKNISIFATNSRFWLASHGVLQPKVNAYPRIKLRGLKIGILKTKLLVCLKNVERNLSGAVHETIRVDDATWTLKDFFHKESGLIVALRNETMVAVYSQKWKACIGRLTLSKVTPRRLN